LVNGNSVSTTGKTFSTSTLLDGDLVSASVSVSDVPCLINATASSNAIEVEIFEQPTASITVSGPDLTASAGQSFKWFYEGAELGLTTQTVNVTKRGIYAVEIRGTRGH
jgi:hypothetical protein